MLGQQDVPDLDGETDVEMMIAAPKPYPEQSEARYYGCENCGRELLRCEELERSEFHAKECVLR